MKAGVLALQGAYGLHLDALDRLRIPGKEVRKAGDLDDIELLIIPGGESTTISMLLDRSGLFEAIDERISAGMPVFGTCAGAILLCSRVRDGRPDQRSFGAIDITVRRNGYGGQLQSFEADLDIDGVKGPPYHGIFIRAPVVEQVAPGVEVLASVRGDPVVCRQGPVMITTFHPELTDDDRLHQLFLRQTDDPGRSRATA